MRVMYGIKLYKSEKPFVIIYQKARFVGDPIYPRNFAVIGEREVTEAEEQRIIFQMQKHNRIYNFKNAEDLVNAELKHLILTPFEVEQNIRTYERYTTNPLEVK